MTHLRIADHFWTNDTTALLILKERLQKSNKTCSAIQEYGEKLLRLSQVSLAEYEEPYSTFVESLTHIPTTMETVARAHLDLSQQMKQLLQAPLERFMETQERQFKMASPTVAETCAKKSQTRKRQKLGEMREACLNYMSECTKLSQAKRDSHGNLAVSLTQEEKYRLSVKSADTATRQWINDWKDICNTLQGLEENRIDYLRRTLWSYANMLSSTCVIDDQACERIRTSLEMIDIPSDINSFIGKMGTGTKLPEMPVYTPCKESLLLCSAQLNLSDKAFQSSTCNDEELRSINHQLKMISSSQLHESRDTKVVNIESKVHPDTCAVLFQQAEENSHGSIDLLPASKKHEPSSLDSRWHNSIYSSTKLQKELTAPPKLELPTQINPHLSQSTREIDALEQEMPIQPSFYKVIGHSADTLNSPKHTDTFTPYMQENSTLLDLSERALGSQHDNVMCLSVVQSVLVDHNETVKSTLPICPKNPPPLTINTSLKHNSVKSVASSPHLAEDEKESVWKYRQSPLTSAENCHNNDYSSKGERHSKRYSVFALFKKKSRSKPTKTWEEPSLQHQQITKGNPHRFYAMFHHENRKKDPSLECSLVSPPVSPKSPAKDTRLYSHFMSHKNPPNQTHGTIATHIEKDIL
ncbi:hypothetical protein BDF14DRAFT_1886454 [Spinellus fusiger]|nr:hypothetical protein BDF14DRAFT_1886454 [Spinellus fusiger]